MAIIIFNPLIKAASGRLGNIILYHRYGSQCARRRVQPADPGTEEQRVIFQER